MCEDNLNIVNELPNTQSKQTNLTQWEQKNTYRTAHPAQHAVHAHDDAHEDHSHQHKVDVLQVLFRPRAGCVLIHKWVYTVSIARTYF